MVEMWRGVRRGVGVAIGFAAVTAIAGAINRGSRPTLKGAFKGMLGARKVGAEIFEHTQDLYAEAESEYNEQASRTG